MKDVLRLTSGQWQETGTPEGQGEVFAGIGDWLAKHRADGTITEAHQLQAPTSSTTVVPEHCLNVEVG